MQRIRDGGTEAGAAGTQGSQPYPAAWGAERHHFKVPFTGGVGSGFAECSLVDDFSLVGHRSCLDQDGRIAERGAVE